MPLLHVISPGFQTTVQDLGRYGYAHLGVSASGAADAVSLRLGNLLVGNPEQTPALEMTLVGTILRFEGNSIVAITGSDFQPDLDGVAVPLWTSLEVRAGQLLSFKATRSGARCYLSIRGGIEVPLVLGSVSTHLTTGLGGYWGRSLRKGDVLTLMPVPNEAFLPKRVSENLLLSLKRDVVRLTRSSHANLFPKSSFSMLCDSEYEVSEESNRMGIRLIGEPLVQANKKEIITEGVPLGAVQIPHGGQPIILFVEHQTTGGYPKIANVISADFHAIGQLRPRDCVSFEFVEIETAVRLAKELHSLINPLSLIPYHG
ncbi:MAG: biotin-dependent carboxyltransferase family protein [bacterium]